MSETLGWKDGDAATSADWTSPENALHSEEAPPVIVPSVTADSIDDILILGF
jgi:hypothetical protein